MNSEGYVSVIGQGQYEQLQRTIFASANRRAYAVLDGAIPAELRDPAGQLFGVTTRARITPPSTEIPAENAASHHHPASACRSAARREPGRSDRPNPDESRRFM